MTNEYCTYNIYNRDPRTKFVKNFRNLHHFWITTRLNETMLVRSWIHYVESMYCKTRRSVNSNARSEETWEACACGYFDIARARLSNAS